MAVLFTSFHDKRADDCGAEVIELTGLYNETGCLWKHITDSSFHCDALLAKKIALCIGRKIQDGHSEKDTFQDKICYFGPPEKRAPEIQMYKDPGLESYVADMPESIEGGYRGGIVMNCNPFTLGHQYLIKAAAAKTDCLYIFVVQEDRSFFKFEDRFAMVKAGVKGIRNVVVLKSGSFMISANTLPGYFDKEHLGNIGVSAVDDLELFASISRKMNIKVRFVGTEPKDGFTNGYNQEMKRILPLYGIEVEEIDRRMTESSSRIPISATDVRELLINRQYEKLPELVPDSTIKILKERGYIFE